MYSPQEILDRVEIQDRINLYCHALDDADYDQLDEVFLSDAVLDYSCLGLAKLTWLEMKERLRTGRPAPFDQHLYSNSHIRFGDDGNTAFVRSKVFNPQGMPGPDGKVHFFGNHGDYHDEWHRTDAGWRIRSRRWDHKFYSGDYPFDGAMTRADQYRIVDDARATSR